VVQQLDPIFATLAPGIGNVSRTSGRERLNGTAEQGYLHCGPNGAGHFVKMVHNGIEYGIMAAYAEGLGVLKAANVGKRKADSDAETTPLRAPEHYQYEFNVADIAELWRRGSVVSSWLF
jgi:6-phosphogluconate dehydrogenase